MTVWGRFLVNLKSLTGRVGTHDFLRTMPTRRVSSDTARLNRAQLSGKLECPGEPLEKRSKMGNETENFRHDVKIEKLTSPVKSDSDKKEYRVIKLPNGLKAVLISDLSSGNLDDEITSNVSENESESSEKQRTVSGTETESCEEEESGCETDEEHEDDDAKPETNSEKLAACALTIGVGSFSDPPTVPGLAHFLEHMVFMGSEKYPGENELEAFLNKKGGHDNAWTECETTTFYFEVHEKYLDAGLDRFAQFFISPLMMKGAISREREAVDSEFQIARPHDGARFEQLISGLAAKDNPVQLFRYGNLVSLKDNVAEDKLYEELHKFRQRHYSAHRMTLALQARCSLDVLEELAVKHFANVPTNDLPPIDVSKFKGLEAFDFTRFHKIIKMKTMKDIRKLEMIWVLPSLLSRYRQKSLDYITSIIGHEGRGSLVSNLRKKKLCLELCCGNDSTGFQNNSMYTLYVLSVVMTEEGCNRIQEICDEIFSYINMLKEQGPQERIYKELQKIEDISFKFEKEQSPVDNVENLSENMHFYAPEDYIRGESLYFEFCPEEIRQCMEALDPAKVNVTIQKKEFDEVLGNFEFWFGTEYKEEDVPKEWVEKWRTIKPSPEYHLPEPNVFIAEDFTILPLPEHVPSYPKKVFCNEKLEVWFRVDPKFKLPDACIKLKLVTPKLQESAKNSAMGDLYIKYLTMLLIEEMYPAMIAKMEYKLASTKKGLLFEFYGFNHKIELLVKAIMNFVVKFPDLIEQDMFEAIKERELRCYYNRFIRPKNLTKDSRMKIILKSDWMPVEKYEAAQEIDFNQFLEFSRKLTDELYMKFHAQGNLKESSAVDLAKDCAELLNYKPLPVDRRPQIQVMKIPPGETFCKLKNMDKDDTNSIVMNYYQSEQLERKGFAIIDLLMLLMEEPLFNQLRTKEQLGYIVGCVPLDTFGVQGFLVNVNTQATKFRTDHVDEMIEKFFEGFKQELAAMSEEEFETAKDALIKLKRTADNELQEEFKRNWEEIESERYAFDRREQDVKEIEKLTLKQILDWFDEHTKGGKRFKKLSMQAIGSDKDIKDKEETNEDEDSSLRCQMKYVLPTEEEKKRLPEAKFISCIKEFNKQLEPYPININAYEQTEY